MSSPPDPKHLLVVEDDRALRDWLQLELRPHALTVAAHQEAAYAELASKRFDLVLLDLRLPVDERDIDPHSEVGFDILRSIRRQHSRDRLPVVVMTAFEGTSETAVRALQLEANDYWSKDGSHSRSLSEVIERTLRQQADRRARAAEEVAARQHRLDFSADRARVVVDGLVVFTKKRCALLALLRDNHVGARGSGRIPSFVPLSRLAHRLDTSQDYVRQLVMDIREAMAACYAERHGVMLDANAVIESVLGAGYRLNPGGVEIADFA